MKIKCEGCEVETSLHDTIGGLCMVCAEKRLQEHEQLETENTQLRVEIKDLKEAMKQAVDEQQKLMAEYLKSQARNKSLKEQRNAMQRRAESAESDWQIVEAKNKQFETMANLMSNLLLEICNQGFISTYSCYIDRIDELVQAYKRKR